MIIDKALPYWTEEDRQRLDEIEKEENTLIPQLADETLEYRRPLFAKWQALGDEANDIYGRIEDRYITDRGTKGLLEDAVEIADAIERADFQQFITARINHISNMIEDDVSPDIIERFKPYAIENYKNCFTYIRLAMRVQENALVTDEDAHEELLTIIDRRASLWYDKPSESEEGQISTLLDEVPDLTFTYPDKYLQSLTKASSRIFDSKIPLTELQQVAIDVTPNKGKSTNSYLVNVDMTAPELKGTENITEFDESIFNAVISVASSNQHGFFTPKQLATHLLYGDNPLNNNPSQQRVGAVTKSIEKQRHIDITIDWTAHGRLNGKIKEGDTLRVKGYMLPVAEYTATINGQKLHGYQLLDIPPLYKYAQSVGQVGTHPVKMLNVPINLDEQKIVIRDFLLKEISHIKNNRATWNNTITVDRILTVAGVDPGTTTRKKRSLLVKAIRDMLDYWKEKEYIRGYQENLGERKTVQSFTIDTL